MWSAASFGRRQEGFTLLEMVVAVAILGVILAIAAPNLLKAVLQGRDSQGSVDFETLGTSVERYYFDKGYYPTGNATTIQTALIDGGYLKQRAKFKNGFNRSYLYGTATGPKPQGYVLIDIQRLTNSTITVTCKDLTGAHSSSQTFTVISDPSPNPGTLAVNTNFEPDKFDKCDDIPNTSMRMHR